ncbi:phosphogluconate dehydrogenase (NAD(+)-dependent, decarboxylating) [Nocardia carnea]|uniref:phosphogluconate dehydrogenase (NAD(+)-dependent, decarboxylating) n=1 Tax=Nocardia carnea TaxID=37328 RepID=UPI002455796F|nr:decarboxylating 6-phosphogluconate dehydrogenase [Nocardia carnea]
MQIAMVGAGRMGAGLVRRLTRAGHQCVVYDQDAEAANRLCADGATAVVSLEELVDRLATPRIVWIMVPAALTDTVIDAVAPLLDRGDVVIDGGNSFYRDDVVRARSLAEQGIHYIDVGTSGGVHGAERGFCLMIGGESAVVARLDPIFHALAPGAGAAARTPGRTGAVAPAEDGYLHCGPAGAGHFVKMVHNGIEYGHMAALAEGMAILRNANIGNVARPRDAETAPVADASFYTYDLDIAAILEVWRRGSVVSSWLVDLTAAAVHADPDLDEFTGRVADSGEGRWTVQAAVDEGVPAHVLAAALFERFASQAGGDYAGKALSAMRHAFGGHIEKAVSE